MSLYQYLQFKCRSMGFLLIFYYTTAVSPCYRKNIVSQIQRMIEIIYHINAHLLDPVTYKSLRIAILKLSPQDC